MGPLLFDKTDNIIGGYPEKGSEIYQWYWGGGKAECHRGKGFVLNWICSKLERDQLV